MITDAPMVASGWHDARFPIDEDQDDQRMTTVPISIIHLSRRAPSRSATVAIGPLRWTVRLVSRDCL